MSIGTYNMAQSVHALNNDQEISVYALTAEGKKAMREAVAELTQGVDSWSKRQASTANEFLAGLEPEIDRLREQKAELKSLITKMHNADGGQADLQADFFALETQVTALANRVLGKQDRIDHIVSDLLDPVESFSRTQLKYPTLRRSYMAAFGK